MHKLILICSMTVVLYACDMQSIPTVTAVLETTAVSNRDDAADDPAIWINPLQVEKSLVIGTNKQKGLEVYNLQGERIQTIDRGRLNNVDLRQDVDWNGRRLDIVVASNRSTRAIDVFFVEPQSQQLKVLLKDGIALDLDDPYGICLYHNRDDDSTYVFVNGKQGRYQQWLLQPQARLMRQFTLESQPEGCVVDDDSATIYLGEENKGLWKASARPDDSFQALLIDEVGAGRLTADVEGMTLYRQANGKGFLIVSSQGNNSFAVYQREGANKYLGSFRVASDTKRKVDGVSETDGLAVTSTALGPDFPDGMLVVQDGHNTLPGENQNFKYISWREVMKNLEK